VNVCGVLRAQRSKYLMACFECYVIFVNGMIGAPKIYSDRFSCKSEGFVAS
jgi:hypothetical protein